MNQEQQLEGLTSVCAILAQPGRELPVAGVARFDRKHARPKRELLA